MMIEALYDPAEPEFYCASVSVLERTQVEATTIKPKYLVHALTIVQAQSHSGGAVLKGRVKQ